MSVYYCAITNQKSIVCYAAHGGYDYSEVVRTYLLRSPQEEEICFKVPNAAMHALTVDDMSFLAATDSHANRQTALTFLRNVAAKFASEHSRVSSAKAGSEGCLQASYGPTLQSQLGGFGDNQQNPKLAALQGQVSEVTGIVRSNINHLNERGEKIDNLVIQTDELQASASSFHTVTKKVERQQQWKNMKLKIIIISVVAVVLLIILLIILWQAGVFNRK